MDVEAILPEALRIVEEAGTIIRDSVPREISGKGTKENFATDIDISVQEYLKEKLTQLIPGSVFLGEEGNFAKGEVTWIVDPIDGTVNFSRGIQFCAISVALAVGGEVKMGIVHDPYLGETYHAVKGKGSHLNGKEIHVSDRDTAHSVVCLAWSTYDKSLSDMCFEISRELHRDCIDLRRIGSAAYELCLIARGSAEMLFEMRLYPWDFAAGALILREAGGFVSSIDGDVETFDICTVVASNSQINQQYLHNTVKKCLKGFKITESLWNQSN